MTPTERVAAIYKSGRYVSTFRDDLEAHLLNGYVISTPEFFVMGRAVDLRASTEAIQNPWHVFPRENVNCWLVFAFAGGFKSKQFLQSVPFPLEFVAWNRRGGVLRVYEFEKCISTIHRFSASDMKEASAFSRLRKLRRRPRR